MKDHPCEIKGPLGFFVLWIISKKASNGVEIAADIEKRRGCKPSPGTIYPVLKDHKEKGLIKEVDGKKSVEDVFKDLLAVLS